MPTLPERAAAPIPAAANTPDTNLKRRRFLLALGAGTAGTAAATASAIAAPVTGDASKPAAPATGVYQETEHVRAYYATARL